MTRQHTAYKQSDRFEAFKDAVLEFTNAAVLMSVALQTGKGDPMQIGSLGADLGEWSTHDGQSGDEQSSHQKENLWAVAGSRTRFTCGGKGHMSKKRQRTPVDGKGNAQGRLPQEKAPTRVERTRDHRGARGSKGVGETSREDAGLVVGHISPMSAHTVKAEPCRW